jgi:hypothetical protein
VPDLRQHDREAASRFRRLVIQQSATPLGRTDQEVYVPLPSLQQREYLRVRTICIPRAGDLATCTHVPAGST